MKTRKSLIVAAVALPLVAYVVVTTRHIAALEQRLATLETSHQQLVRYTHDFGLNVLGEARFSGAFRNEMLRRTVNLAHGEPTVCVSTLSQVHQNAMPGSLR